MACKSCGFSSNNCAHCGAKFEIVKLDYIVEVNKEHDGPVLSSAVGSKEYRMLLLGLPGSGVSSTANTILNSDRMKTQLSFDPTTKTCILEEGERLGYKVKIVDTPGFNAETSNNGGFERFKDLKKGIELLEPGPNALILVTAVDRYNTENDFLVSCLNCLEGISKFTIVVFTNGDNTKKCITKEIISQSENLKDLLALSEARFLIFRNVNTDELQFQSLMDMVKQITDSKKTDYFDNSIFSSASAEKLSNVVAQYDTKRKDVISTFKQF